MNKTLGERGEKGGRGNTKQELKRRVEQQLIKRLCFTFLSLILSNWVRSKTKGVRVGKWEMMTEKGDMDSERESQDKSNKWGPRAR